MAAQPTAILPKCPQIAGLPDLAGGITSTGYLKRRNDGSEAGVSAQQPDQARLGGCAGALALFIGPRVAGGSGTVAAMRRLEIWRRWGEAGASGTSAFPGRSLGTRGKLGLSDDFNSKSYCHYSGDVARGGSYLFCLVRMELCPLWKGIGLFSRRVGLHHCGWNVWRARPETA